MISVSEILEAINNGYYVVVFNRIDFKIGHVSQTFNSSNNRRNSTHPEYVEYNTSYKELTIKYHYSYAICNCDENNIVVEYCTTNGDKEFTANTNNVLLTPPTIKYIIQKRNMECSQDNTNNIVSEYVNNTYERYKDTDPIKCISWLLICLFSFNKDLNSICPTIFKLGKRNMLNVSISEDMVQEHIPELYNLLMKFIEL